MKEVDKKSVPVKEVAINLHVPRRGESGFNVGTTMIKCKIPAMPSRSPASALVK